MRFASPVGLCAACRRARVVKSARGSVFLLCKLSQTDPAFPKYPSLPVVSCAGYEPTKREETASREES